MVVDDLGGRCAWLRHLVPRRCDYLPPFFLLVVYPGLESTGYCSGIDAWLAAGDRFLVGLLITVAPYSISASKTHGGFMVTDATAGHVLYLGNNDFPPLTFDYGNGCSHSRSSSGA